MSNDQLTRAERVRLEALAQANAYAAMRQSLNPQTIMKIAEDFERFIKQAKDDA